MNDHREVILDQFEAELPRMESPLTDLQSGTAPEAVTRIFIFIRASLEPADLPLGQPMRRASILGGVYFFRR